jgi:predicted membrane channel-forming protein YqfA (hemolysin III family)
VWDCARVGALELERKRGSAQKTAQEISSRHDHLYIQWIVFATFVTFCVNGFSPRRLTILPFVIGLGLARVQGY